MKAHSLIIQLTNFIEAPVQCDRKQNLATTKGSKMDHLVAV